MIPAIICFFSCLLAGALVARSYEERCKALRYSRDLQREFTEKWFNKYLDESLLRAQESVEHERSSRAAAEQAAETLKDAVELERYLRDEERDEADRDIELVSDAYQEIAKYYFELCEAVEAKGATLKEIRRKLSEGEL